MESITWFGHWLWFHWFVREDGAWLVRIHLPRLRAVTLNGGLTWPKEYPNRIAGYFYESGSTHAFVALLRIPGQPQPLRYPLGYAPPSPRFERWLLALG